MYKLDQRDQLGSVLTEVEKLIASKNWNMAQPLLHKFCQLNSGNADIPARIGMYFQSRNMPVKAEMFYLESLKINNQQAILHFNLGLIYQMLNKLESARNAYKTATDIQPDYARAHANLGYVYSQLNHMDNATKSFSEAIRLMPDDPQIKHMMAAVGITETPSTANKEYIKNTFDGYASYYDNHLLGQLKTRTPQLVYDACVKYLNKDEKNIDILDLGCGTGLCGALFKTIANRLVGVDLSGEMVNEARKKNIYTELYVDDIGNHIRQYNNSFDTVIASDVFVYIGDLDNIFKAVHAAMKDNSVFSFTTEALQNTRDDYKLEHTGRYKHSHEYIERITKKNGFTLIYSCLMPIRQQNGIDIPGYVYSIRNNKNTL